jgi:uncharacterized protein (TIGR03435 family)
MRKLVFFCVLLAALPLFSQPQEAKPSFEVASVKRSAPGGRGQRLTSSGGRFSAGNMPLRRLLVIAFNRNDGAAFLNNRIIGGPGWIDTDTFDIEAKSEEGSAGPIPRDKLQPRLQSLLEDRFQLKVHWEKQDTAVYLLTVGKGGSKLKSSDDQSPIGTYPPTVPIEQRRGMMIRTEDSWVGNAVQVSALASFLSGQTGRPVFNKTGLDGFYDFKMHWVPPPVPAPGVPAGPDATLSASDPGPSIFTAIEEIGLKLEAAKAPLEVLVIDHVERPSEN